MVGTTSSAEPDKLFQYADLGTRIDQEMVSEALRLGARLSHFSSTCTEHVCQVGAEYLGDALRAYGSQNEETDSWVRRVGQAFLAVDMGGSGQSVWLGVLDGMCSSLLDSLCRKSVQAVVLFLLSLPEWLQAQVDAQIQALREIIDFLDDLLKPIDWVSNSKKATNRFRETLRRLGERLNGWTNKTGYVEMLEELGDVLLGTATVVSALSNFLTLRDFQRYFAGELTNQEVVYVIIPELIPIPGVADKIAAWLANNILDPQGRWQGFAPKVGLDNEVGPSADEAVESVSDMQEIVKKADPKNLVADLRPEMQTKVTALIKNAHDRGLRIQVFEGLRSVEEQNALYEKGRRGIEGERTVTNARGGESFHQYRVAVDIVFLDQDDNPSWDGKHDWDALGQAGKDAGLEWGGDWPQVDRPHFQLPDQDIEVLKKEEKA